MKPHKLTLLTAAMLMAAAPVFTACSDDEDDNETIIAWHELNQEWLGEQVQRTNPDGSPYYTRVAAPWDEDAIVLMHWFNDRTLTQQNLTPLYTSTIDVRYQLFNCNDARIDSSLSMTKYGPGVARIALNHAIAGWGIAFSRMHVGDSCEIIIPYGQAYGTNSTSSVPAYSNLRFNVRLVDIPFYEVRN